MSSVWADRAQANAEVALETSARVEERATGTEVAAKGRSAVAGVVLAVKGVVRVEGGGQASGASRAG